MFRLIQGVFSAALVPLSQAILLDIYPQEQRGFAMAIWGLGVMIGPILGPTLGGYLTDFYSWRYVFYINLPFGLLATAGLLLFLPRCRSRHGACASTGWGSPRSPSASARCSCCWTAGRTRTGSARREIMVEAVLAGLGLYLFVVHVLYAPRPLIRPQLFRDMNFSAGLVMMFAVGTILVSSIALMAPWLQTLADYPVATAGLVMAPRGLGNVVTITISGRLSNRVDPRLMVGIGLLLECWSFWEMTAWTPDVSVQRIIVTIFIQGAGLGLVFTPLQVLAFATLAPSLRTEGASLFSLARNIGAAIGVSVTSSLLAHNAQILHEQIGALVTPFNRALQVGGAVGRFLDPDTRHGAMLLDQIVNSQAQVIAYVNDYVLMVMTTLPALLLLLLMRRPRATATVSDVQPAD